MFIDVVEIILVAGKGGDGCVSCRREKYVPRGGPDGGNGGKGGSIWFVATSESSTLLDFRYRKNYKAGAGSNGQGKCKSGASGDDLEIPVPCGTSVYVAETGDLMTDLIEGGDRFCAAQGGRGGKGNYEFRSARNQTPMYAQSGKPGVTVRVRLELKLIADIGLIGEPNAGKSTLLSVLTAARPKVADYPFTTLAPNLGIVDLGDYVSCTLADIPGLIAGASVGKGLGLEFLRHVERTRALLYMVDMAAGPVGAGLEVLRRELVQYGRRLPDLPFAVALTKSDLVVEAEVDRPRAEAAEWVAHHGGEGVVVISAVTGSGLSALRHLLRDMYRKTIAEISDID